MDRLDTAAFRDERVSRAAPRLAARLGWLSITLACVGAQAAPPLPADPTRPPGSVATSPGDGTRAPRAAAIAGPARPAPPRPAPLPELQAVLQPQHGPATALLDGRWLRAGEQTIAWQIESIRADGLLLRPLPAAHRPGREPVWLPLVAPLDGSHDRSAPPAPDAARMARTDARKEP